MRIRITVMAAAAAALITAAVPAFAQTGNGAPSGGHYNLNIIGVENPKTGSTLTDSNRKTIFVALGKTAQVTTRIYLTQGPFKVCDGNGFDAATDCSGNPVGSTAGAVFQLPCNTNLSSTDGETVLPCDGGETAAYEVWARALGQPGGNATVTTCADEVVDVNGNTTLETVCSTENVLLVRGKGKSSFTNVTQELTSLVACVDETCTRYALFRDELEDWFWQYENRGLRLAQLRFYVLD
jgi:hypothetical protein